MRLIPIITMVASDWCRISASVRRASGITTLSTASWSRSAGLSKPRSFRKLGSCPAGTCCDDRHLRVARRHVLLEHLAVARGQVVARHVVGDVVGHEHVDGLGGLGQQARIGLHLLDRAVDDRLEGALDQRGDEVGEGDRPEHLARRAAGALEGVRAGRRGCRAGGGGSARRLAARRGGLRRHRPASRRAARSGSARTAAPARRRDSRARAPSRLAISSC